ncbi:sushi, von Willebrand factor type A, EGF and pentraxin domain-containing protein 1-like [Dendronephthya gigantea]|uniref:sushi, von Willebrand factor type A, EGF and pentraxin domain-containing protein 1-like n=1 Tax=Dendronephthya gigantea TaxID=151771 RepID=UPI00106C088E|nr:sushi, von Willebrand factor type A, EGF and pentraxin domain-containing protein 1-like [Dendronephthya gigantea]
MLWWNCIPRPKTRGFGKSQILVISLLFVFLPQSESLDFCFDANKEGFRLNRTILKRTNAPSKIQCILSCVKEQCCRSVNYWKRLQREQECRCEMLHDVIGNKTAETELEKNSSYDYVYLTAPLKGYNSSCANEEDFDLSFESVQKFTLLDNDVPEMSDMTFMFWINTLNADKMTVLSYAVNGTEEFAFSVEREKMYLKVQRVEKYFFVPPINDGYWHHVGASWSQFGNYTIFLDGTLVYSGDDLGSNVTLKSGGAFVVGQEQGSSADGNSESSFSGKLSQLNVWSRFMSADAAERKLKNQSCLNKEALGNVFTWSSLKDNCNSMVVMEQPSSCKPLRKNSKYDIVIKPSQNNRSVHNITYEEELHGFTITAWVKYEKNASLKLNAELQKFLDYKNDSGTSLLSFYLTAESLALEIDGGEKRQVATRNYITS